MDSDDEFVILDSPATEQNDKIRDLGIKIDTLMLEMNRQARKNKIGNDELHATVGNSVATMRACETRIDQLKESVNDFRGLTSGLVARVDAGVEQAEWLHSYIGRVGQRTDDANQKLVHFRDSLNDTNVEHTQTINKLDMLSDDNKALHETVTGLRNDNAALQTKVEVMEEALAATSCGRNEEVNELRERVGKLEEMNSMLEQLVRRHADKSDESRGALSGLVNDTAALKQQVVTTERLSALQTQKSDALETKFYALEEMLNAKFDAQNSEHGVLKAHVDPLHEASTAKIVDLPKKILKVQNDAEGKAKEASRGLTPQLEDLNPDIAPPIAILKGLCCERDGLIKDQQGRLVGRVFSGSAFCKYMLKYKCDENGHFRNSKGDTVTASMVMVLAQPPSFNSLKAEAENEQLRARVTALEQELDAARAANDRIRDFFHAQKCLSTNLCEASHHLQTAVKEHTNELQATRAEHVKIKAESAKTQAENATLQSKVEKMVLVTESLSETIMANQDENEKLQAIIENMKEKNDKTRQRVDQIPTHIHDDSNQPFTRVYGPWIDKDKSRLRIEEINKMMAAMNGVSKASFNTLHISHGTPRQTTIDLPEDSGRYKTDATAIKAENIKLQGKVEELVASTKSLSETTAINDEKTSTRIGTLRSDLRDDYKDMLLMIAAVKQEIGWLRTSVDMMEENAVPQFAADDESNEVFHERIETLKDNHDCLRQSVADLAKGDQKHQTELADMRASISSLSASLQELRSKVETSIKEESMRSQALQIERNELHNKVDRLERAQYENQSQ
ncbi:hypothetical protein FKW77_004560 [Venturia effusa]|uniref:Uncharacterized protein n=1 Tax=Venturia effusa TaxID=50376 RepID=A0A517LH90_9PEZI|nr:hypothetical protein FKW77_004560 [Venturia effusa]